MANPERDRWFQQWSREMASPSGSKVDMGPNEALASKPGRAKPKPGGGGRRVPGPEAGQVKKL